MMDEQITGWLADLTSGDDQRAEAAVLALGSHATGAAVVDPLLASPDPDLRWWGVRTLAELPPESIGLRLAQALEDEDIAVRHCAALGLAKRPSTAAIPALVQAMQGRDSLLARISGNALAAGGEPAVTALLELLKQGSMPARLEAVRALAQAADPRSIPAMFDVLEEDSALMGYWANAGLERMGVGMTFFKP